MSYIRVGVSPEALDISDDGKNVHIFCGLTQRTFLVPSKVFKKVLKKCKKHIKKKAWLDLNVYHKGFSVREIWIDKRNNIEVDIDEQPFGFQTDEVTGETIYNYKEVVRMAHSEDFIDIYLSTLYYLIFANNV